MVKDYRPTQPTKLYLCEYNCCNIIDMVHRICPCALGECKKCNERLVLMDGFGDNLEDDFYDFLDEPWGDDDGPEAA